jgi:hypothetical protein
MRLLGSIIPDFFSEQQHRVQMNLEAQGPVQAMFDSRTGSFAASRFPASHGSLSCFDSKRRDHEIIKGVVVVEVRSVKSNRRRYTGPNDRSAGLELDAFDNQYSLQVSTPCQFLT